MTIWLRVDGRSVERVINSHKVVCDRCEGTGKVSRFEGECFSLMDFDGDPEEMDEFARHSAAGMYDIRCPDCKGANVVDAPNLGELNEVERQQYRDQCEIDEYNDAVHRSEARYGA